MISLSALKSPVCRAVRALSASPAKIVAGRGGRSSTNARTVTIFGGSAKMARFLVNNLGQCGTQIIISHRCDPTTVLYHKVAGDLGQIHFVYTPDLNDEKLLEETVQYSDVVVNLTGSHTTRLHNTIEDCNVAVTHRIARACKNAGVPAFIHMSHLNADHNSLSAFCRAKALSEEVVLHELPDAAIIVRAADCFHGYDNFTHYLAHTNAKHRQVSRGFTRLYRQGLETYKVPVYGPDVMRAVKNIILMHDEDRQRLYQFVGPTEYTLRTFMDAITDITYRRFRPVHSAAEVFFYKHLLKWDPYIRYQLLSDVVVRGLPGLEDVGVEPRAIEDVGVLWLRAHRIFWQTYDPEDGKRSSITGKVAGSGELF